MSLAQNVTQLAPSCTDHELIVAVRAGSDRAFEELYGRYVARIRAYVLGMVGDHGRAEDVAQDVFIAALRRLRETSQPVAFKPWIYEIARNACIDEFRRRRRALEVSLDVSEGSGEFSEQMLSRSQAPEAAIENKQKLDDLRGAFQGLSENHHRIMVMRELEGLSYRQIGDRMGMSKPMVESTLFRARRRLHAEYDELVSGRRCEQVQTVIAAGDERPALGTRQRRQLARHLAHCQPCRRVARVAGLDESFFHAPGLVGKIAALLPFPWLRLRRGSHGDDTVAASGSPGISALRPLQAIAQLADPTGPLTGFGRAATAAAATLVVAGAGGGIVASLDTHQLGHPAAMGHRGGASPASPGSANHRAAATAQSRRAQSVPGPAGARAAGSSTATGAAAGKAASGRQAATHGASTAKPNGGASQSSTLTGAAAGAAAAVPGAAAKLGGGVTSATGLLGGGGSGAPVPPKLPKVGLPSVQSVTDAVNNIHVPLPPPPRLSLPKVQLP